MNGNRIATIVAVTVAAFALADLADAAKLGGGRSLGAQRQSVAPRAATPPAATPPAAASQPVMPAQPGATLPAKPATPAAVPQPSGMSRWLGPIAGLAAGLGLAALLSHFGLSEGFASLMLIALLAIAAVVVVRMLLARRAAARKPLAYATAPSAAPTPAAFDATRAGPWGSPQRVEPVLGPAPMAAPARRIPAGFDAAAFARHAKAQFLRLQAAHDAGDRATLAEVLTPEMLAEVTRDLAAGAPRTATEFVTLDAEVLEAVTEGDRHWASIRFSGVLREGDAAATSTFDEVWNLTKPVAGASGWLLAGIQQHAEPA